MQCILLDGSPKVKDSTSKYILEGVAERLEATDITWYNARKYDLDDFTERLAQCQALVIAFPLYVDSIPSHLLSFLMAVEALTVKRQSKARVYAVVNSGFYEAKQNIIALEMVRLWCQKSGLKWGQGVALGGGGMAQTAPLGKGPCTSIGETIDVLADNIQSLSSGEMLSVHPDFPRFLYKSAAHLGWRKTARKNGNSSKDMYAQQDLFE